MDDGRLGSGSGRASKCLGGIDKVDTPCRDHVAFYQDSKMRTVEVDEWPRGYSRLARNWSGGRGLPVAFGKCQSRKSPEADRSENPGFCEGLSVVRQFCRSLGLYPFHRLRYGCNT